MCSSDLASRLIEQLRLTNDRYALQLADKSIWRLGWRYVWLRSKFNEYREDHENASELDCFLGLIRPKLTNSANGVVRRALKRNERYEALFDKIARVAARRKRFRDAVRLADQEAEVLKALVDFELREHVNDGPNWRFLDRGLGQLNADFLLSNEYINIYDSHHLRRLCDRFGSLFLSAEDWKGL